MIDNVEIKVTRTRCRTCTSKKKKLNWQHMWRNCTSMFTSATHGFTNHQRQNQVLNPKLLSFRIRFLTKNIFQIFKPHWEEITLLLVSTEVAAFLFYCKEFAPQTWSITYKKKADCYPHWAWAAQVLFQWKILRLDIRKRFHNNDNTTL